jgi:hypothetical protein
MNLSLTQTSPNRRQSIYHFGDYNPYLPSDAERELVLENLARLRSGETSLEGFLKQTPQFARWGDEHIRQAQIMLITNEPGLSNIEQLYGGLVSANSVEEVARCFQQAMFSWLSLTDHSTLGGINGEHPWVEHGAWEQEHPALALCGKAGYFMAAGEEQGLSACKVLKLDLSAFPQANGLDVNPRNDQRQEYHAENRKTVKEFCRLATAEEPRYIFIIANRARILRRGAHAWQLDTTETPSKDKSCKIVDLLRVVDACGQPVQVRLCRQTPRHGRSVDILNVTASIAYELQPVSGKIS